MSFEGDQAGAAGAEAAGCWAGAGEAPLCANNGAGTSIRNTTQETVFINSFFLGKTLGGVQVSLALSRMEHKAPRPCPSVSVFERCALKFGPERGRCWRFLYKLGKVIYFEW